MIHPGRDGADRAVAMMRRLRQARRDDGEAMVAQVRRLEEAGRDLVQYLDRYGPRRLGLYEQNGLDDRTAEREAGDGRAYPLWSPANNRFGWAAYLRTEDASQTVSPYAAPARSTSLAGLPRTWLGVGDQDLFHEEDLAYASRLKAEGVACGLHVAQGAFHAFDLVAPRATVSRRFAEAYRVDLADALRVRLDRAPSPDGL